MKSQEPKLYVVLDVRFKLARGASDSEQLPLFVPYFVSIDEVSGRTVAEAFRIAKRRYKHPIIEDKQSFWAKIEAAKAITTASRANALYQGNRNGHS